MNDALKTDRRFVQPLYTRRDASWFLRIPEGTLTVWSRANGHPPLVTTVPSQGRNFPSIPFIGLAEALVVRTLRRTGPTTMSMHRIRKGLARIEQEIGLVHALASRRLLTDGVELFYDYAKVDSDMRELAEVIKQQYVLEGVLEGKLQIVTFGQDDWPEHLTLPFDDEREIVHVRPDRAFGQPYFINGGGRLRDVLARIKAGEPIDDVAKDFGVPMQDVLDILRGFIPEEATT
jgi:uncharacterized protein (DUF433 family)